MSLGGAAMGSRDESPWTEAEEAILAKAYSGGKGLSEISRSHHRAIPLIEEKLTELGEINRIYGSNMDEMASGLPNEPLGDPMPDLLKHTRQREREEANHERSAMLRETLSSKLELLQDEFDAGLLDEADFRSQSNRLMALIRGGEGAHAWLGKEEAARSSEQALIEAGGDGRWSEWEDDPWEE